MLNLRPDFAFLYTLELLLGTIGEIPLEIASRFVDTIVTVRYVSLNS